MAIFSKSFSLTIFAFVVGMLPQAEAKVGYQDVGTSDFLDKIKGRYEVSLLSGSEVKYLGQLQASVSIDGTYYPTFTTDFNFKGYFVKNRSHLPCYMYGRSLSGPAEALTTCATPHGKAEMLDYTLGFGLAKGENWIVFTNDQNIQFFFARVR